MADPTDNATRLKQGMASIFDELETLYAQDQIGAVLISIVKRDGGIRTLKAYDTGFRTLIIAAAALAAHDAIETTEAIVEEHWRAPPDPKPLNE